MTCSLALQRSATAKPLFHPHLCPNQCLITMLQYRSKDGTAMSYDINTDYSRIK